MPRVIVVGAGMAGLTAADVLGEAGIEVTVVDKGRAVGGRMASRRIGDARFDHGAQHFSVRTDAFARRVDEWKRIGLVGEWFTSPSVTDPDRGLERRHVGVGGMREIPEHLARGLDVRTGLRLTGLSATEREIAAVTVRGPAVTGDAAIVTPPVPQALALLDGGGIPLPRSRRSALADIGYDACLAVMARLDGDSGMPDGHLAPADGPIAWLADNRHKRTSAVPALTIHSTAQFAAGHLDADPARWTTELVEAAGDHVAAAVVDAVPHRWRYAMPRKPLGIGWMEVSATPPVLLAGEAFSGARVEGAFLSGTAAGREMVRRLG